MSSRQAASRNVGTSRPDAKGASQAGGPRKALSTDAGPRDGAARSSDESLEMGPERRGCIDQPEPGPTSNGRSPRHKAKPFEIPKREVWEAYKRVRENQGAAGVDGQSIADFEADLAGNLYKVWNRMSSGTWFPPPVRRVDIPKGNGGTRPLGIPTVADRVAQMVVKRHLEPLVEPHFHANSYGYRPGRSALDAVGVARQRCWREAWVLDLDIKAFFECIDHDLLLRAVRKHTDCPWALLYIERWLKAPALEAQAKSSIATGSMSMRETDAPVKVEVIEERIRAVPEYVAKFNAALPGTPIDIDSIAKAIAAYECAIEPGIAPFDRWIEGDESTISESAKRGFVLFNGKGECFLCHSGWRFTNDSFHDIGTTTTDNGRGRQLQTDELMQYAFKTPTLRSVALRPPFMHNGSLRDLYELMKHYEKGGIDRPSRSPLIKPIALSDQERLDIIAFMETLSGMPEAEAPPKLPGLTR